MALLLVMVAGLRAEDSLLEQMSQLNEAGTQAFHIADYPTALQKWKQGLKLARQAKHN